MKKNVNDCGVNEQKMPQQGVHAFTEKECDTFERKKNSTTLSVAKAEMQIQCN